MAKVSKSASRSIYIRSDYSQGSMTVWALRDFVKALDEHGVPDNTTLSAERDHNTLHFIAISVRVTTEIDEPALTTGTEETQA